MFRRLCAFAASRDVRRELVMDVLRSVSKGVEAMVSVNDNRLRVHDIDEQCLPGAEHAEFELNIEYEDLNGPPSWWVLRGDPSKDPPTLIVQSPVSGIHSYSYQPTQGGRGPGLHAWISERDEHLLIEMMTRDLLRVCNGVPNF